MADSLEKHPYYLREFIEQMGAYLKSHGKTEQSVVLSAYKYQVPIFVPAFSDCATEFGLVYHQ